MEFHKNVNVNIVWSPTEVLRIVICVMMNIKQVQYAEFRGI